MTIQAFNAKKFIIFCIFANLITSKILTNSKQLGKLQEEQKPLGSSQKQRLLPKTDTKNEEEVLEVKYPAIEPVYSEILIDKYEKQHVVQYIPVKQNGEENFSVEFCPLDYDSIQKLSLRQSQQTNMKVELPFSIIGEPEDPVYRVLNISFDKIAFKTFMNLFGINEIPSGNTISWISNHYVEILPAANEDPTQERNSKGVVKDEYKLVFYDENLGSYESSIRKVLKIAFSNVDKEFIIAGKEVYSEEPLLEEFIRRKKELVPFVKEDGKIGFKSSFYDEIKKIEFHGLRVLFSCTRSGMNEKEDLRMIGLNHLDNQLEDIKQKYQFTPSSIVLEIAERLKKTKGYLKLRNCDF